MNLERLHEVELLNNDVESFASEFRLVREGVDFATLEKASIPSACGCYFWLLSVGPRRFKIYLGRTRSLSRRLLEYRNPFQVHSPNDFKLQFFWAWLTRDIPAARLDLYFRTVPPDLCKAAETELVRRYRPLINCLPPPTLADRQAIQFAFEEYYRSATERYLTDSA